MPTQGSTSRIVRFGTFEVDLLEGRLTKSGLRVRLQGQPFQILALLLERPGEVVTREEIRQKLWSEQTFVEFDDALNTAVGKLRAAIGDTADNPRFVETVPRRGYRFIAPVTGPPRLELRLDPIPSAPSETPPIAVANAAQPVPGLPAPVATNKPMWRWYAFGSVAVLAIVAATIGIYTRIHSRGFQTNAGDTVIVADFVNTTGETVFDDALRQALEIGLEQSPSIQIMPERKASFIMTEMGRSAEDRMTGKTAIEVCQRAGGKVTIQGSIASLGTVYLIGLAAIRCDNGEPIANEQAQARHKEQVVDVLGHVTAQLRSRLGESLPSIQKYNAPLDQATTSSLDALNAYGLGLVTWDKKGDRASLPILKKAVELDPNFAQAYGALATIYYNLGQADLARENATKAYELRAHVTQAERSSIEARYFEFVTGELEKEAEVRSLLVENYPESAGALNHVGNADEALGRYDQAVEDYRRALAVDPTRGGTHSDLATVLLALNRIDEASAVLADANKRSLQTEALLQVNYWVAFLRGNNSEMARLLQESSNRPETQALLLAEESNTEAYYGHLEKASALSSQAATLMEHEGDRPSAARYLGQAALREAEIGDARRSQELISRAQRLSHESGVVTLAALTMARLGNIRQAEELCRELNAEWPAGTYAQKYWLPVIKAQIELGRRKPLKALEELSSPSAPLEFAAPPPISVATLYPAYIRGQAYLAAHDVGHAAIEFQKLRDHRDSLANYPLGPLALAQLGRTYTLAGDNQKARQSYREFFDVWKDADPRIQALKESKAEYSKLQ
ncbi:MAG: winged helix-turn-helix domain-containing protein [Terracidiphilus sp.]|jgi:DNA-binding winged helix-turn-helix (wHTH) protein/tetratricopeptide (TPR) repeat protein